MQPSLRRALRHDVLDAPLGALLPFARLVACSHPRGVKRRCSRLPLARRVAVVVDKEDVRLHRVEVCAYNDTRPRTRPERAISSAQSHRSDPRAALVVPHAPGDKRVRHPPDRANLGGTE